MLMVDFARVHLPSLQQLVESAVSHQQLRPEQLHEVSSIDA
jgi:hypothetical protein